MPYRESDPADLEASREARIARRRRDKHEGYLALLKLADRIRADNTYPPDADLAKALQRASDELQNLSKETTGWIVRRRRPAGSAFQAKHANPCTIFLDECGTHHLTAADPFPVFVLAAVIIPDSRYGQIEAEWKAWKKANLGSADALVHEPDLRRGDGPFRGTPQQKALTRRALRECLRRLDFTVIACAVRRPEYLKEVGNQALDSSLPSHPYLMTLDFLAERVVMALDKQFGGARGRVVAESRGAMEDALLQYEFARLHLDGTSYIAEAWFRQQLHPGVQFCPKDDNSTGLQLADLIARPIAEKVINPAATPEFWPQVRIKLCQGQETKHSIVGLKIVPWDATYKDLWRS